MAAEAEATDDDQADLAPDDGQQLRPPRQQPLQRPYVRLSDPLCVASGHPDHCSDGAADVADVIAVGQQQPIRHHDEVN